MARRPKQPQPAPSAAAPPAAPPAQNGYAEWQRGLTRREQWLHQVLDVMSKGHWLSGVTDNLLAAQWGCTPANVRQIAAEANRVLRARLREDPEARKEARAMLLQTFEAIRTKAILKGDPASLRVALDAARAWGFYMGLEPAKRLDVNERSDPFEGWSTEEKLAFSREGKRPRRSIRRLVTTDGIDADDADDTGNGEVH